MRGVLDAKYLQMFQKYWIKINCAATIDAPLTCKVLGARAIGLQEVTVQWETN
jgi:hypothetical protein